MYNHVGNHFPVNALCFHWLGYPHIDLGANPVRLETRKATAVLAYLSLNPFPIARETLAAFFWPESDTRRALGNLRRCLFSLNQVLGTGALHSDRETISLDSRLSIWVDALEFTRRVQAAKVLLGSRGEEGLSVLAEAAGLYRGDFLEGLILKDCPAFEEWCLYQREGLRRELGEILESLSVGLASAGRWDQAGSYARRWCSLDALNENAHRMLMQIYAQTGQTAAVHHQFQQCRQVLMDELGQEPKESTRLLYERIQSGGFSPTPDAVVRALQNAAGGSSLPIFDPLAESRFFLPAVRPNVVSRERLVRIFQNDAFRVLLVSAPAGFGKTTAAAEWARRSETPVAWLSLEERDNDPTQFMNALIAAIHRAKKDAVEGVFRSLQSYPTLPAQSALAALIQRLEARPAPLALVLDDYQVISSSQVHRVVTNLLIHLPQQVRVVIVTREDPPFPLARLRAGGELGEIRADALRFTAEEATRFLGAVLGFQLASGEIAQLTARTEGWIAGLQMAALGLQAFLTQQPGSVHWRENVAGFIDTFSGASRYILEYLTDEVLARQPQHVQQFLLRTSILDRFCAPLCDAILAESENAGWPAAQDVLSYLEHANLFLEPLDGEGVWFRYHFLFSDLLRSRLHKETAVSNPEMANGLHIRASQWLEEHDDLFEAVAHAVQGCDYPRAADILEKNAAAFLAMGACHALPRWMRAIPEDILLSRPRLCLEYARVLCYTGQPEIVEALLNRVERQWIKSAVPEQGGDRLWGYLAEVRMTLAFLNGNCRQTLAYARLAEKEFPPDSELRLNALFHRCTAAFESGAPEEAQRAWEEAFRVYRGGGGTPLRLLAMCSYAWLYYLLVLGRLRDAQAICLRMIERIRQVNPVDDFATGYINLSRAEILLEQNELVAAKNAALDALEHTHRAGNPAEVICSLVNLARVYMALGEEGGAHTALEQAEDVLSTYRVDRVTRDYLQAVRLRLLIERQEMGAVADWLKQNWVIGAAFGYQTETRHIAVARAVLALNNPERAKVLLDLLAENAQAGGRLGHLLTIRLLQARTWLAVEKVGEARVALLDALRLGEPEGFLRAFLEEGVPLRRLLANSRAEIEQVGGHGLCQYAERILQIWAP